MPSPEEEEIKHGGPSSSDEEDDERHDSILSSFSYSSRRRDIRPPIDAASLLELQVSSEFEALVLSERWREWGRSLYRLDPRLQIATFFDDVARDGGIVACPFSPGNGNGRTIGSPSSVRNPKLQSPLLRNFARSSVFTVWRPTSIDAIRAIVTGAATGKGLDIKGKSAKGGILSGYVPFLQIKEEAHKKQVRTIMPNARVRVFYGSEHAREVVLCHFEQFSAAEEEVADEAEGKTEDDVASAHRRHSWEMIDAYAESSGRYGIECSLSLFWDAIVVPADISRPEGSDLYGGRPSEPAFQDMNNETVRKGARYAAATAAAAAAGVPPPPGGGGPCPVLWQSSSSDPLDPRTLLLAYEERGRVLPVVSDFDCFTVGTRGVRYDRALPPEQIDLMRWSVSSVEYILEENAKKASKDRDTSWCKAWLEVLKRAALEEEDSDDDSDEEKEEEHRRCCARKPDVPLPPFGFGDPTSYDIIEQAVHRLTCGAVRHGAECFNYAFPQDVDEYFLVVSDTLPGNVPWKYVTEPELRELLMEKIEHGFSFPVNPKWVMCDKGWKDVYDKLVASDHTNIQSSVDVWFPPGSGLRERIEEVCAKHPEGFNSISGVGVDDGDDGEDGCTGAMDLAELELERYRTLLRAKRKLRCCLKVRNLVKITPHHHQDDEDNLNAKDQVACGRDDTVAEIAQIKSSEQVSLDAPTKKSTGTAKSDATTDAPGKDESARPEEESATSESSERTIARLEKELAASRKLCTELLRSKQSELEDAEREASELRERNAEIGAELDKLRRKSEFDDAELGRGRQQQQRQQRQQSQGAPRNKGEKLAGGGVSSDPDPGARGGAPGYKVWWQKNVSANLTRTFESAIAKCGRVSGGGQQSEQKT